MASIGDIVTTNQRVVRQVCGFVVRREPNDYRQLVSVRKFVDEHGEEWPVRSITFTRTKGMALFEPGPSQFPDVEAQRNALTRAEGWGWGYQSAVDLSGAPLHEIAAGIPGSYSPLSPDVRGGPHVSASLCDEIDHDWHDAGGGIDICGECEETRENPTFDVSDPISDLALGPAGYGPEEPW